MSMGSNPFQQLGAAHHSAVTQQAQGGGGGGYASNAGFLNGGGTFVAVGGGGGSRALTGAERALLDLVREIDGAHGDLAAHNACVMAINYLKRKVRTKVMKTYALELRMDFADKARHDDLVKAMRQSAKLLFTQASLLSDGRTPEVALRCEDFFEGTAELEVVTDDE
jgi:hypothetical protein